MGLCTEDDCTRKTVARGLCKTCYARHRRYGTLPPLTAPMQRAPDDVRCWSKVDRSDPDGCWPWIGHLTLGYGYIYWKGKMTPAHRVVWQLLRGPIPNGADIDHLCRQRICVNPDHLEPVTHRVNLIRGDSFAGHNARKTHCPQGHEYTPENTIVRTKGDGKSTWTSRECQICTSAGNTRRVRAFRARQRSRVEQP